MRHSMMDVIKELQYYVSHKNRRAYIMAKRNIIYSSELRDWTSDKFKQDYRINHELSEEEMSEVTDDTLYDEAVFENEEWLSCERENLDVKLSNNIIIIADLDLWNGHKSGYKVIGNNLNNILSCSSSDYYEVYCDSYNVRAESAHHDGTNSYLFREIKENVNIERLKEKIYNNDFTSADISRYTKSLRPYVAKIYGW